MLVYSSQLALMSLMLVSGYTLDGPSAAMTGLWPKKPRITAAAHHELLESALERMTNMPTISLRPLSDYVPTSSISLPTPIDATGLNITIFNLANKDVAVVVSPDLLAKLQENMKNNCTNQTQEICEDVIKETLHNPGVDLERRFLVVDDTLYLVGAASAVLVSVFVQWWMAGQALAPTVRIPQEDIAQATSVAIEVDSNTTPIAAVIEAPSGFRETISESSATIKSNVPSLSVSTLTADTKEYKAGQILLTMPQDLADRINEMILNSNATCPAKRDTSSPDLELGCIIGTAETLLDNARSGYGLESLLGIGPYLSDNVWQNGYSTFDESILDEVVLSAKNMAPELDLSVAAAGGLAFAVAILTISFLRSGIPARVANVLPTGKGLVLLPSGPAATTSSRSCTRTPACAEPSCNSEYYAVSCNTGEYSGCSCSMTGCQLLVANATDVANLLAQVQSLSLYGNTSTMATSTSQGLCTFTDAGPGFSNSVRATPNQWCVCTHTSQTIQSIDPALLYLDPRLRNSTTTGTFKATQTYGTITSKSSLEACAYNDVPKETLNITWGTPVTQVTDCREVTAAPRDPVINAPYCTCNDEGKYDRVWMWDNTSDFYKPICTDLPRPPRIPLNGNMIVSVVFISTVRVELPHGIMRTVPKQNWTDIDPCSWINDRPGTSLDPFYQLNGGMFVLGIAAFGATPALTNCTLYKNTTTSVNAYLGCVGYGQVPCEPARGKSSEFRTCQFVNAKYMFIAACIDPMF